MSSATLVVILWSWSDARGRVGCAPPSPPRRIEGPLDPVEDPIAEVARRLGAGDVEAPAVPGRLASEAQALAGAPDAARAARRRFARESRLIARAGPRLATGSA